MANKENLMNENANPTIEEVKLSSANSPLIEQTDAFAWRRESEGYGDTTGYETLYTDIGLKLQRYKEFGKNGKEYTNYAVAFILDFKGVKQAQTVNFSPVAQRGVLYNMLAAIFGDADEYPLEIVKTVTPKSDTRPERTTYSARVSCDGDFGNKVVCSLNPSSVSDRHIFNNLIELLRAREIIK